MATNGREFWEGKNEEDEWADFLTTDGHEWTRILRGEKRGGRGGGFFNHEWTRMKGKKWNQCSSVVKNS
jgi:hypothetical protein